MKAWKTIAFGLGLALAAVPFAPAAKADVWDRQTIVTFASPVEVPGRVLIPGTYTFKLADSDSNRQIVEVYNDKDHLVTILLAVADFRLDAPSQTVMTFNEGRRNTPEALREWFYPGNTQGLEFVYPARSAK